MRRVQSLEVYIKINQNVQLVSGAPINRLVLTAETLPGTYRKPIQRPIGLCHPAGYPRNRLQQQTSPLSSLLPLPCLPSKTSVLPLIELLLAKDAH